MKKGRLFVSDGDVPVLPQTLDLMRIGKRDKLEEKAMSSKRRHGSWILPSL